MTSASFTKMATVTASTKRPPNVSGGKRGAPVTNIASLSVTPLDPISAELKERLGLESPMELLQTFADGSLDIKEGDILTVSGTDYPIRAIGDWTNWSFGSGETYHLILEELKQ